MSLDDFDFDYWMNLANTNPEEFERARLQLLREMADFLNPDNPEKAERIFAKVHNVITRSNLIKNPLSRAAFASNAMHDSLGDLNELYNGDSSSVIKNHLPTESNKNVISFDRKKDN